MSPHRLPLRGLLAGSLVGLLLVATFAPPVAAQADAQRSFVVELEDDGSATVTVSFAYDLADADARDAFETLVDDAAAREDMQSRFADRMANVVAEAAEATGRQMTLRDASIEISETDDGATGVVSLSVAVTGLAARSGGQLVLTEPFASGYEPDRRFVVRAPDGYAIVEASPRPDASGDTRAEWAASTSLDGLRVVLEPTGESNDSGGSDETGSPGQPGFGVLLALAALLVTVSLARLSTN